MEHAFGYLLLAVKALPCGVTDALDIKLTSDGARTASAKLACSRYMQETCSMRSLAAYHLVPGDPEGKKTRCSWFPYVAA